MQPTEDGKSSLTLTKVAAVVVSFTLAAAAQSIRTADAANAAAGPTATADATDSSKKKPDDLEEVVVTGSLIPMARAEISTPVSVITIGDIQEKGFTTVADALQHTSFATGAIQGPQQTNGFTPGASTLSLFGLSPSYTKFLIDGRPMADYPALYNGSQSITSISGIPTLLVDKVEILPGAQSSIYGSDAIAGVVNISLKKTMEGPSADVRYGWTQGGGGVDKRIELADGFQLGGFNVLVGAQYEKTTPIWGYQRSTTSQYYTGGPSAQTAERDYLVIGLFGPTGDGTNAYYFPPGASCDAITGQYFGTGGPQSRPNRGQYCGTKAAGFYTINSGTEATQAYMHVDYDLNDYVQFFGDVLIDHDYAKFSNGAGFYETSVDGVNDQFYDPNLQDYITLQRIFSPEEAGGLSQTLNKDTTNSIRATVGAKGALPGNWNYSADFTFTEYKLTETLYTPLASKIDDFFAPIFGPQEGLDPNFGSQPVYEPNYAAFYKPLTPAEWASFQAPLNSYSRTEESLARLSVTNSSLFALPGGNAGIAVVVDGGGQGWDYYPDPNFLDGGSYLYTSVAGSGHRARYSGTTEMRLPVVKMVTLDLSGRYDDYKVAGQSVDKFTYNIGVEFRPIQQVLLRGRYGTAFKAPTLADQFQGQSGYFQTVTDYYQCAQLGYTGSHIADCTVPQPTPFGTTSGDPKLKPITAKVYDIGIALTPIDRLLFTADFIHWKISNEITIQPADQLLKEESACRLGELDPTSPTCVNALASVVRDPLSNTITDIITPKVNVADETLNVFTATLDYTVDLGRFGNLVWQGSYSNVLKHTSIQFPGDPEIDLIENPFFSQDFKTKENLSVSYNYHQFGTTLYVERYGRTPNYVAYEFGSQYDGAGAGRVSTWTLANLSARYEVLPGLTVSGNVINLFDKGPPVDNSYPGTGNQPYLTTNYNPYGRSFFVEASYKFGKSK